MRPGYLPRPVKVGNGEERKNMILDGHSNEMSRDASDADMYYVCDSHHLSRALMAKRQSVMGVG